MNVAIKLYVVHKFTEIGLGVYSMGNVTGNTVIIEGNKPLEAILLLVLKMQSA